MTSNHPSNTTMEKETLTRFLDKIEINQETCCWIWTSALFKKGYGLFQLRGKSVGAHRVSYEHFIGPIPEGLFVLHNCPCGDNPSCVNPNHLKLGDAQDNMDDMFAKGRAIKLSKDQHPMAKLSSDDVLDIKELYSQGFTQLEIADFYGVHRTHIGKILAGKLWKE